MKSMLKLASFAAIVAVASLVVAQQPPIQRGPVNPERPEQPGHHAKQLNGAVADCLMLSDQAEIVMLQWAQPRIQNPELKEHVQKMLQDHQQVSQKLQQFAAHADAAKLQIGIAATDERQQRTAGFRGEQGEKKEKEHSHGGESAVLDQLFQIGKETTENCLRRTQQQLSEKKGEEFEKAFVGQQIGMHIVMLSQIEASKSAVEGQLQQTLEQEEQSTKEHLQMLEKHMESLTGKQHQESDQPQRR